MYLGFYTFYKRYNKNRMLTEANSSIGDDLMYQFVYAAQKLREMGHQVATLDMDALEKFDAALFFDHPTFLDKYFRQFRKIPGKKLYVFLLENPANRPDNYWKRNHEDFDKVFTWDPGLIDHKKYFPWWPAIKVPENFQINRAEKIKFCVTIASQKYVPHSKELYSERVRGIRWFEQNHPQEFDLYGQSWDRRYFTGKLSRLNLFLMKFYPSFPNAFKANLFPSWRGAVPNKNKVMREYKFALCYENAAFDGYVTEKIFDGFLAGCVPVYIGAPDITKYIPAETFIDLRKFKNYEELYAYLKAMPEAEYQNYLDAIIKFMNGRVKELFGVEAFMKLIQQEIIGNKT